MMPKLGRHANKSKNFFQGKTLMKYGKNQVLSAKSAYF
jgi:hypothetical protein